MHLRMFEPQPLDRVGEFDVDADVVGVLLQLVALEQAAVLVDVEHELATPVDLEPPMPVLAGSVWKSIGSMALPQLRAMHYYATKVARGRKQRRPLPCNKMHSPHVTPSPRPRAFVTRNEHTTGKGLDPLQGCLVADRHGGE